MCGESDDENRPGKGWLLVCQNPKGRYILHADLIGARNVTRRTLLVRQDWIRTGIVSLCPDASDNEATAVRLQRYALVAAESRWNKPPLSDRRCDLTGVIGTPEKLSPSGTGDLSVGTVCLKDRLPPGIVGDFLYNQDV